jgi:hypothetical protein
MICLPQPDDADRVRRAFCKCNKRNAAASHPNSNPSRFAIVLRRIGVNKKHTAEHLLCVSEVEAVFPDVGPVLGLVPFKIIVTPNVAT